MGPGANVNTAPPAVLNGRLGAWLRLGRVSNLPTVWTNSLAAVALSGETAAPVGTVACMALMSVSYVAGMVLNDAFDAGYDAIHRPSRPIPSGMVSKGAAFTVGFGGLGAAIVGVGVVAQQLGHSSLGALCLGAALGALIVAYDAYHKTNPLSPVVMGACRALVYLTTAYAVSGRISNEVLAAGALQWSYIIGLTYAAKQEDLARPGAFWPCLFVLAAPVAVSVTATGWWGSMPFVHERSITVLTLAAVAAMLLSIGSGLSPLLRQPRQIGLAVGRLIAGVAVLDAMLIATTGWFWGTLLAVMGAALTRLGQRFVPGT